VAVHLSSVSASARERRVMANKNIGVSDIVDSFYMLSPSKSIQRERLERIGKRLREQSAKIRIVMPDMRLNEKAKRDIEKVNKSFDNVTRQFAKVGKKISKSLEGKFPKGDDVMMDSAETVEADEPIELTYEEMLERLVDSLDKVPYGTLTVLHNQVAGVAGLQQVEMLPQEEYNDELNVTTEAPRWRLL